MFTMPKEQIIIKELLFSKKRFLKKQTLIASELMSKHVKYADNSLLVNSHVWKMCF